MGPTVQHCLLLKLPKLLKLPSPPERPVRNALPSNATPSLTNKNTKTHTLGGVRGVFFVRGVSDVSDVFFVRGVSGVSDVFFVSEFREIREFRERIAHCQPPIPKLPKLLKFTKHY